MQKQLTPIVDQALLGRAHDHALRFLNGISERHVGARATREELIRALGAALPQQGESADAIIDTLASQAERGAVASAGPRYFGFVIGGSYPVGVAADWLAAAWDQNSGIFVTSPLSATVEELASNWLLQLLQLPESASVGFVTGGQMANTTCLAAARHHVLRNAGWNVEEQGLIGAPAINLVVSAEAHATIYSGMRLIGLGTAHLKKVPTDDQGRMRADELARVLETLSGPTIVCAQAGNVNTGSFDPLRQIGELTREHGAWLHVDGAFGLWARASRDRAQLADGLELADSWATDAHKWLNVPYDCGVAIVRHSASHRASMTVSASYLEQTVGAERDPLDWVPEFSRRARGFSTWAVLRHLGARGVEELIDRSCALARQMADLLRRDPRVEILNDVVLNQVLVRIRDNDEATRETVTRIQQDGTCWLAGTTWKGKAALRISISNWATSEEDIERSAAAILRVSG